MIFDAHISLGSPHVLPRAAQCEPAVTTTYYHRSVHRARLGGPAVASPSRSEHRAAAHPLPRTFLIDPGNTRGKPQRPPAGNRNPEAAAATSARANPQQPAPIRDSQRRPASIHLIGGPICLAQCCGKMLPRLVCISREGICLECATCECASRARSPLRICGVERAFVARIVYISKYLSTHHHTLITGNQDPIILITLHQLIIALITSQHLRTHKHPPASP